MCEVFVNKVRGGGSGGGGGECGCWPVRVESRTPWLGYTGRFTFGALREGG